jgi:hypothetical protein
MTTQETILKTWANFVQTYKDLGWRVLNYSDYEEAADYLVSVELLQKIEGTGLPYNDCRVIELLEQHPTEFIMLNGFYTARPSVKGNKVVPLLESLDSTEE